MGTPKKVPLESVFAEKIIRKFEIATADSRRLLGIVINTKRITCERDHKARRPPPALPTMAPIDAPPIIPGTAPKPSVKINPPVNPRKPPLTAPVNPPIIICLITTFWRLVPHTLETTAFMKDDELLGGLVD